mmetsp:Transcript_36002/g.90938  ORF Transcript_36002/g.90938 Transcript_36002/m.90938 type:complete len:250 (+) Transcript_36002:352-1101(+)
MGLCHGAQEGGGDEGGRAQAQALGQQDCQGSSTRKGAGAAGERALRRAQRGGGGGVPGVDRGQHAGGARRVDPGAGPPHARQAHLWRAVAAGWRGARGGGAVPAAGRGPGARHQVLQLPDRAPEAWGGRGRGHARCGGGWRVAGGAGAPGYPGQRGAQRGSRARRVPGVAGPEAARAPRARARRGARDQRADRGAAGRVFIVGRDGGGGRRSVARGGGVRRAADRAGRGARAGGHRAEELYSGRGSQRV